MPSFTELQLSPATLKAISDLGFSSPSEIQSRTIPVLLTNQDLIGQAGTGTGKTAAFAIPVIEKLDSSSSDIQALVLCPTRELAVQVAQQFALLMKYHKGLSCLAIYGGQNINIQLKTLRKGPQVLIATPGRMMDHIRRGSLKLSELKFLILDEADRMLDMGFKEDIEDILKGTPKTRQTIMFSATMHKEILKLTQKYQNNPEHIDITAGKEQSPQIEQIYFDISRKSKTAALKRLLVFHKIRSALIFCNTKAKVDELARNLKQDGFSVGALHGDIRQNKRDSIMNAFRKDSINLLVATDVAARGIDVSGVEAVFNYDLPRSDEDYLHRIGRTGRAGKGGLAISFAVGAERQHLERIARINSSKIIKTQVPSIEDLALGHKDKALIFGSDGDFEPDNKSSSSSNSRPRPRSKPNAPRSFKRGASSRSSSPRSSSGPSSRFTRKASPSKKHRA